MIEKIDFTKISLQVAKSSLQLMGNVKSESDILSVISASVLHSVVEEVNSKIDEINKLFEDLKKRNEELLQENAALYAEE